MTFDPLPCPRLTVTRVESTGWSLLADVNLDLDPYTAVVLRRVRAYRGKGDVWQLGMPSIRNPDTTYTDALTLPRTWRRPVLEAIVSAATERRLLPQAVTA